MKGKILYVLLLAFAVLLILVKSYGLASYVASDYLVPLNQYQEIRIDTLEAKLARLQANGSVIIPIRQGFPYCEPFTGTIAERLNTVVGGFGGTNNAHKAALTANPGQNNGVLQLTNIDSDSQLGYAFIDLPFSSTYGIKVSFEYFIYNNTFDPFSGLPNEPGDGISFFLYDGAISAGDFRIGGLGGSLGYAPHGYSNHIGLLPFSGDPGIPTDLLAEGEQGFGGLKGGYLGIGFDVFGKFGNEYERRYGGFSTLDDYWASHIAVSQPRYPNSVIVRGPQIRANDDYRRNGLPKDYTYEGKMTPPYNSYQFVTGKVTYKDPIIVPGSDIEAGTGSLPASTILSPMFKLSSPDRVDCGVLGSRKVFIDFKPIDPTNTSAGFEIKVDMLVDGNPVPINILDTFFVPSEQVPATFKLGFAGATGSKKAYQEIRNVTAQVSNENQLTKPETEALDATACIGSEEFFELDVTLRNLDSEIQCIQLYATESEALEVNKEVEVISSVQDCASGVCQIEVCTQERLTEQTPIGDFEAFLFLENGVEVPKVKFESTSGATGSTTIWYTVTDNFGQISAPKPIKVTINPFPRIDGTETIVGPTCDGQSDGTISNVVLKNLIPGYSFSWSDASGNILPSSSYLVSDETTVGGYTQATVGVTGVNLGEYFLTVRNPATNSDCDDKFPFEVKEERGSPVLVNLENQEICEGTPASFEPRLEDPTDANNPKFIWWKDINKTQPISNNLVEGAVTYQVSASGVLTIIGLAKRSNPYEFFVEVAADPSQNLCATPAGKLRKVEVLVLPPLVLDAIVSDDFCLVGTGEITVNASGGFGTYTFSLDGAVSQSSNTFSGLFPGTYTIEVSAGSNCFGSITREVLGAPELFLEEERLFNPACGTANGLIEVSFSGGTPGYTLELFKNGVLDKTSIPASSTVVFQDLAPGNYQLKITDAKGCFRSLDRTLTNDVGTPITIDPMLEEICEGDLVRIVPKVQTAGNASLRWYKDSATKVEIVSNGTPDENGYTYTINSTSMELEVGGLVAGNHSFYLVATGPGYCPSPPFEAQVSVVEPITSTIVSTDETCFGASDGTITVNAIGADSNFEYSLNGSPFVASNQFMGLVPGRYTIDIRSTGSNGCSFQTEATIVGPTSAIVRDSFDILRSSCNASNGSIENVSISGGWGEYTFEWRRGSITGPVVSGDITGASNLAPGDYFLIVRDRGGCQAVFDFLVTEQPQPVFAVNEVEICAGEEVLFVPINIVSGSSHTELAWYKDAEKTKPITSGTDPTDSDLVYTLDPDSGNLRIGGLEGNATKYSFFLEVVCTGQIVEAKALVRNVPAPIFSTEPVSCFGGNDGKIVVESGGDPNYLYSVNGGTPVSEAQLEVASFAAMIYSVEVSNQGFCLQDFSVEVIHPDSPLRVDELEKVDPSCGANTGIVRTKIHGGWSPYKIELVKDGIVQSSLAVEGTDVEFKNLAPGDYSLLVTDTEGCEITSNTVSMVFGPTVIEVEDVEICEGQDAVFVPKAVPSASGAIFEWYKDFSLSVPIGSSSTPDAQGHTFEVSADGVLTVSGLDYSDSPISFYVIVSGGNSCPGAKKEVKAKINRIPVVSHLVQNEVCFGEKGKITLLSSAGDGTYSYSIDGVNFQNSAVFSVMPGVYTGYVRSGAGCIASLPSIQVGGASTPLVVSSPVKNDAACNSADGSISFDVSGGYGNYTITVLKNNQSYASLSFTGGTYTLSDLGSGSYQIEVRDSGGCVILVPGQIEVEDLPTPVTATGDVICEGGTANLVASTSQLGFTPSFTWYLNSDGTGQISSGTQNGVTYQIGSNGRLSIGGLTGRDSPYIFYVKVSGSAVCEPQLVPVEVMVYKIPNLRVSNPSIVCDPNGFVDLTQFIEGFNPSVYSYQILNPSGAPMRLDEIEQVVQSGSYLVKSSMNGANCWTPTQRIQVLISEEELIADFAYSADLGGGNFVSNSNAQILEPVNFQDSTVGKVIVWNWDFGDGASSSQQNPSHVYQKKGEFTVTLTTIDEIGCISERQQLIKVLDDYVIIVPNAFTPTGVKNQYFKPQFRGVGQMEFYIFSIWGELIFQTNSLETLGWDGTINGQPATNGNYVYRGIFETRSGEKVEKSGVFTLIR